LFKANLVNEFAYGFNGISYFLTQLEYAKLD